jgi:hypothetical protein
MFKNNKMSQYAEASVSEQSTPGDERLNNEANYELSAEPTTTKTTHTLQDEDTPEALMDLESRLRPEGFASKSFQMTEMLERQQILTTLPIRWSSTSPQNTILTTVSLPKDLAKARFFANKMENFHAIHTDIEVTVKVNPTPFDQGALLIILHPKDVHLENLPAYSYYPHELINLPTVNHAAIKVPFLAENEAYSKIDDFWQVSVIVASPLRTATLPHELEVNIFGRFVKPELMIPIAQSEVADQKKDGLVTRITGTAADVLEQSGTALRAIPVVGEFIPPLTWAVRCANKVASYFGWSKAPNMEHANLMVPIPAARMCHGEGIDNGIPLALIPDNTCNTASNSTDIDEMDMSYLFERKFIRETVKLENGENFKVINLGTEALNTPTTILTMFRHRRWMRCFEFHMVKTKYHTGRLLVQYDYNSSINDVEDARVAMSTVYSKIIDISQQDSFTFTVPWMDISPFDDHTPGRIVISTFNDIVTAETVAQEMDLIVYHSYRDVQLGQPTTSFPVAQGECCGNSAPIPTDDLIPYKPQSMVEYTMGESVSNLRVLTKRFTFLRTITVNGTMLLERNIRDSLFGQINAMYLARAGSIRYKIVIPRGSTLYVSLTEPNHSGIQAYATQIFNGAMNNVAEFMVPFYHPKRRSFEEYPWPDVTIHLEDDNNQIQISGSVHVYVAAGDDYNAMFPLGIQPKLASNLNFYGLNAARGPQLFLGHISLNSNLFTFGPGFDTKCGTLVWDADTLAVPDQNGNYVTTNFYAPISTSAGGSTVTTTWADTFWKGDAQDTLTEGLHIQYELAHYAYTTTDTNLTVNYMSRCVNKGTISSAGVFTPNDSYNIYYGASATNATLLIYNTDTSKWVGMALDHDYTHPDYYVEGARINRNQYDQTSFRLIDPLDGSYIPSTDSHLSESTLLFATGWTGHFDSGFVQGHDDTVSFVNQVGHGFWAIAKDATDDKWYQIGYNRLQKRLLREDVSGDVHFAGLNFPRGTTLFSP